MKFNERQIEFMKKIGISIDFSKELSDSALDEIEEKVSKYLQMYGFDNEYKSTEDGNLCESILDFL